MTGKEIKIALIERNLTTKEVAKAIGVTRSRVSHCLNSDIIFEKIEEYLKQLDSKPENSQ